MGRTWGHHPERGSPILTKFIIWVALRLGRPAARSLLYPICAYFVVFSPKASQGITFYLQRVLGRSPTLRDLFHHYHCFASTILDRVYLLTDQFALFDVDIHGAELLYEQWAQGQGCLLLGSHLGSFDIVRTSRIKYFQNLKDFPLKILMYEEATKELRKILDKLNPHMAQAIIPIGTPDAMLQVKESLDRGEFIGILGDRTVKRDKVVSCRLLGMNVDFPAGPMILATILRVPVILFFGLYRGGNKYEIYFEPFIEELSVDRHSREKAVREWTQHYAERLEFYCLQAPYNWFHFFDYWNETD